MGIDVNRLGLHASNRDPEHRPHADRQARRGAAHASRHASGRCSDPRGARTRRRRARAGRARRDGHRAAGGPGPDPDAPGADRGRDPDRGQLGDDQQGVRVERARGRDDRPGRPRRRSRRRGRRRDGVDVAGALPAARRAPGLPHGRREDARRDGPGRAAQPVHGQADVRGGDRGRRRARDDPRGPRQVGAAHARARDRRHRRGPPRRGDRRRSRSRARKGDTVVEIDEAPRRGSYARGAREAAGAERQGRLAHGRQLAGRQRRRGRARARVSEDWAEANGKEVLATIVAQAAVADEFAYLARTPANAAFEGARQGRPAAERHRPVGDQRGVLLGRAEQRRGCSGSTRSA